MTFSSIRKTAILLLAAASLVACSSFQTTKNVWKSTKGFWNDYVSPPASVDYGDKGSLPKEAEDLSRGMIGVDLQLAKLERTMLNADKPPTRQWLDKLFEAYPWLNGFAGVKNNGSILGQFPEENLKELDFVPLLYEDKKQNSHALRTDVQPTPLGPEILLASPLYDGPDFLGVVIAYFDFRNLMSYSNNPENLVVLCPSALLWPGKYEFAATPLAGLDWAKIARESSAGVCSNDRGSFFYVVRYLGNLPLIFASPKSGEFPAGDGSVDQGYAFFPREREKLPVPPVPERRSTNMREAVDFAHNSEEETPEVETEAGMVENRPDPNEIQPGSPDSALLKKGPVGQDQVRERALEGENVPVERVERMRRQRSEMIDSQLELMRERDALLREDSEMERPLESAPRPSPFGPREETAAPEPATPAEDVAGETAAGSGEASEQATGAGARAPMPTLPGGRPSPFGRGYAPGSQGEPPSVAAPATAPAETAPSPGAVSQEPDEHKAPPAGLFRNRETTVPIKE